MRRSRIALAALAALVLLMCLDAGANGLGILNDYAEGFEFHDTAEGGHYAQVREGSLESETADLTALEVRLNLGSAVVRGVEGDRIRATYKVRVQAATEEQATAYAAEVKVGIERTEVPGTGATLAVTEPPIRPTYVREVTVDLELQVPPRIALLVETYGLASIRGLAAGVTLLARGNNDVAEVQGDLDVKLYGGSLDARDIGGTVRIETLLPSRQITVRSVGGDLELKTQYENVDVRDIRGTLRAKALSGALRASNVGQGALLTLISCDAWLEDIDGPVTVNGGGGGSCTVAGLRGPCTVNAENLLLRLLLAREAPGFEVNAEVTGGGTASCDYPLQRRQEGDTTTVSGTIGDGRFPIEVKLEGGRGLTISPDPGT